MSQYRSRAHRLPAHSAFVVHFAVAEHATPAACSGRVEHIVSGRRRRFESAQELMTFVEHSIAQFDQARGGAGGGHD